MGVKIITTHIDVVRGQLNAEDGRTVHFGFQSVELAKQEVIDRAIDFISQYSEFAVSEDKSSRYHTDMVVEATTAQMGMTLLELMRSTATGEMDCNAVYLVAKGLYLWRCQVITIEVDGVVVA